MKKLLLFISLIFSVYTLRAQEKGEFQIRAGFGFAGYGSESKVTYKTPIGDFSNEETDGAATVHMPLEFRYSFTKRVNAGLDFKFGSYLYEPDSADGRSNRFAVVGVAVEYVFVAREKQRWYGGLGFNGCSLILEETDDVTEDKATWTYSGGGFRMNTGLMVFLVGGFGLNFNLGYDGHNFKLKNYEINGKDQDLDNFEATLRVSGVDGTLGVFYKF